MGVSNVFVRLVLVSVVTTIFAIAVQSASTPPPKQQPPTTTLTPSIRERVEAVVRAVMRCRRLPGLSVAFVVRGRQDAVVVESEEDQVFSAGYGWADASTKRNATNTTRFCLAGATQPFTAAALLKALRDNQSFALDSPVRNVLRKFKLGDKSATQQLTLRDVLAHRAGLAPFFGGLLLGYNLTRTEIVRRLRFVPAVAPFRHSALPSPLLYVLAGQLVQELSGSSWEDIVTKKFFIPNNMKGSTFADKVSRWTDDFALPHALREGQLTTLSHKVTGNVLRPVGPAASVCASSADMVNWLQFLLHNGTNNTGSNILHPDDINEMFNASNPFLTGGGARRAQGALPVDSSVEAYSLGWITGSYRGYRRLFINGFANSYGAFVSLLPEAGIGIFTAANGPSLAAMDNAFRSLHYWLTDLALNEEPWLDKKSVCTFPRPWLQPVKRKYKKVSTTPPPNSTPIISKLPHHKTSSSINKNTFSSDHITSQQALNTIPPKINKLSSTEPTPYVPENISTPIQLLQSNSSVSVKITTHHPKKTSVVSRTTAVSSFDTSLSSLSDETASFNPTTSSVSETLFTTETSLSEASSTSETSLSEAPFTHETSLSEAPFTHETSLSEAPFITETSLSEASFTTDTSLSETSLLTEISFSETSFTTESALSIETEFSETATHPEMSSESLHQTTIFSENADFPQDVSRDAHDSTYSPEISYLHRAMSRLQTTSPGSDLSEAPEELHKIAKITRTSHISTPTPYLQKATSSNFATVKSTKTSSKKFPKSTTPLSVEVSDLLKTRTPFKTTSLTSEASPIPIVTFSPAEDGTVVFGSRLSTISPHKKPFRNRIPTVKSSVSTTAFVPSSTLWLETANTLFNHVTPDVWSSTPLEHLYIDNDLPAKLEHMSTMFVPKSSKATLKTTSSTLNRITPKVWTSTPLEEFVTDNSDLPAETFKQNLDTTTAFIQRTRPTQKTHNLTLTRMTPRTWTNFPLEELVVDNTDLPDAPTAFVPETTWPTEETSNKFLTRATPKTFASTPLEQLVVNADMPPNLRHNLHPSAYTILDALVQAAAAALRRSTTARPTPPVQTLPPFSHTVPWGSRLLHRKDPFRLLTRQRITKRPRVTVAQPNSAAKRIRRKRLAATVVNLFPRHIGTYSHPFFGDLTISFNRTSRTLQMDYGFYGKAHLLPKQDERIFVLHFFSALWYMSDSDDSRRLPRALFVLQFDGFSKDATPDNVTIPLFESRAPPVFKRTSL